MKTYIVTVKLRKDPEHDPHNKRTGTCPVGRKGPCTDVTGEHHSFLQTGPNAQTVTGYWVDQGLHVTRVEEV